MGPRYKELLEDIFDKKILADDFSLYLHRPTATDDSFAPDGCDSFYVLCPVPNLRGNIDWDVAGPDLQKRIVAALSATILPNLDSVITEAFYMSPVDFKNDYRSMHGAGFSIAPVFTNQPGSGFTTVTLILQTSILPLPGHILALVCRAFCVRQSCRATDC